MRFCNFCVGVVIFIIFGLVGLWLGLEFVERYMVRVVPEKQLVRAYDSSELKVEPLGQGKLTSYDGLQKTAPVHVLEPKVSDVYYQNAPNTVQNTLKVQGQRDLRQIVLQ